MTTTLDRLAAEYEAAEAVFMAEVRGGGSEATLAAAARAVASAASGFNAEAYRRLFLGMEDAWMPLGHLTERTEVLAELWEDLASAYEV